MFKFNIGDRVIIPDILTKHPNATKGGTVKSTLDSSAGNLYCVECDNGFISWYLEEQIRKV